MNVGSPRARPDGVRKVTGQAQYSADRHFDGELHAVLVPSSIPAGRVIAIDASRAIAQRGVVRVLTSSDMPRLAPGPVPPLVSSFMPLQDDDIRYHGQPVAMVVAETLHAAEHAATCVDVRYEPSPFTMPQESSTSAESASGHVRSPRKGGYNFSETELTKGDPRAAWDNAAVRYEATYVQPSRHNNPMEPSATLASWADGALVIYDSVQHGYQVRDALAAVLRLAPENIRVICEHTGGGFGCKGFVHPHEVLCAAAAMVIGRPVRLVLPRARMYDNVSYQPRTIQTIRLASTREGELATVQHESVNVTSISDDYVEYATQASKGMYATATMRLAQKVRSANINIPGPMRAPVEGPGMWALESAIDELARALKMDPLDLRLRNYAEVDPADGRPWSSKKLREAYEQAAARFGWRERASAPRRDGSFHLGRGMASCNMGTFRFPSIAECRLQADGSAVIESGFHDIGTGTLTIFPQIVADVLGLDVSQVSCRMGDTALPQGGPTYGSSSTMGVGSSVLRAAEDVRTQLANLADLPPDEVEIRDGRIMLRGMPQEGIGLAELLKKRGRDEIVGRGSFDPASGEGAAKFSMRTFGAIFVEVGVDRDLGLLRLRRVVARYSAGRIINPRTARSQMTGGIIWGWGMAALEASRHEPTLGRWLAKNLANVALPVNADIPADLDVDFVDEYDPYASALGAKGIGELGATGVAAAVANAVYDAIGVRVRSLPITPDKLVSR